MIPKVEAGFRRKIMLKHDGPAHDPIHLMRIVG